MLIMKCILMEALRKLITRFICGRSHVCSFKETIQLIAYKSNVNFSFMSTQYELIDLHQTLSCGGPTFTLETTLYHHTGPLRHQRRLSTGPWKWTGPQNRATWLAQVPRWQLRRQTSTVSGRSWFRTTPPSNLCSLPNLTPVETLNFVESSRADW